MMGCARDPKVPASVQTGMTLALNVGIRDGGCSSRSPGLTKERTCRGRNTEGSAHMYKNVYFLSIRPSCGLVINLVSA